MHFLLRSNSVLLAAIRQEIRANGDKTPAVTEAMTKALSRKKPK
jgi:hypothetical protein